ncbi:hypothetical protein N8I77_009639 [Diaporthe amygdali]|uniref:F-box domain-containing protein n=1 Tax=Phomopsis amygdali TaxID=1214568 RepID=A0AAD9S9Y3_PHOAM|nr:hypothetical protein N8I77_009639 [Diaporthe amygdali]
MASLPDDVLSHIFSFLPHETLIQCRFLNRSVEPLASALAFRHVHLETGLDVNSFLNIAGSERLRPLVRELTLSLSRTAAPPNNGLEHGVRIQRYLRTIRVLPLVRLLVGLRTLNVRFSRAKSYTGDHGRWMSDDIALLTDQQGQTPICITTIYMETILKCLSGSWTRESQALWEHGWDKWFAPRAERLQSYLSLEISTQANPESSSTTQHFPDTGINLSSLTVSNLSEKDAEYLMSSATLKRFLETQSLSKMQLLTNSGKHDRGYDPGSLLWNRYRFFEDLPSTWLSPSISDRLRTLSLYSHDYWGWCPKVDFRVLSQGPNGTGGLCNLRTLALGRYVFSHQWQIDWIAGLGSDNGRGGLEELYLDDCPIMWRARVLGPVDSEGFPQEEVMTREDVHPSSWNPITLEIDLRWGTVLPEWQQKMQHLKVFRMGYGDWDGKCSGDVAMAKTASRARVVQGAYEVAKRGNEDTIHMHYDKYSMNDRHKHGYEIIRDGVGLSQKRECLLQYVHFEIALGASPWVERDFKEALINEFEDGYQRYEAARRQDEEALHALYVATGCPSPVF